MVSGTTISRGVASGCSTICVGHRRNPRFSPCLLRAPDFSRLLHWPASGAASRPLHDLLARVSSCHAGDFFVAGLAAGTCTAQKLVHPWPPGLASSVWLGRCNVFSVDLVWAAAASNPRARRDRGRWRLSQHWLPTVGDATGAVNCFMGLLLPGCVGYLPPVLSGFPLATTSRHSFANHRRWRNYHRRGVGTGLRVCDQRLQAGVCLSSNLSCGGFGAERAASPRLLFRAGCVLAPRAPQRPALLPPRGRHLFCRQHSRDRVARLPPVPTPRQAWVTSTLLGELQTCRARFAPTHRQFAIRSLTCAVSVMRLPALS